MKVHFVCISLNVLSLKKRFIDAFSQGHKEEGLFCQPVFSLVITWECHQRSLCDLTLGLTFLLGTHPSLPESRAVHPSLPTSLLFLASHAAAASLLSLPLRACLFDWLIDWLIDWWFDWLMVCLFDWLIDGLNDWLMVWLIDWWLVLIDWLIDWSIDQSIIFGFCFAFWVSVLLAVSLID